MTDIDKQLAEAARLKEQKGRERDAVIQEAIQGPTYHKFSDQDKTPQGQKAIEQGIANKQAGGGYDWTKSKGADFKWPDLDASRMGNLEPWLCYQADGKGGWVDLNFIGSGKERRATAAIRQLGFGDYWMKQRFDQDLLRAVQGYVALSDAELDAKAGELTLRKSAMFSHRDYILGVQLEVQDAIRRSNKVAQRALDAANAEQKKEMDGHIAAAKSGGLLDPVKGITMEDWAGGNAKLAAGTDLATVLKVLKIEKPVWDEVSAEWMARMSRDTTFAISTVYGAAFTNPNIGKFASAAPAAAPAPAGGGVQKVMNDFDLYIKIMSHQSAGAAQGQDAQAILKKYGLTVADWSNVGAHWGGKMMTDFTLAQKMGELMAKYGAEFAKPGAGDDISF
jgi:hypothetical protein